MVDPSALADEEATWRDYPFASGRGDSDGVLVLSDDRLTFSTDRAGVALDVDLDGFASASTSGEREGRILLTVRYLDGTHASFWTRANVGRRVVEAIQARHR